ncbi:hypothetical protein [Gordonia sp. MP11Mi]|uniref:Uncharacterized protein n=1 Tax=Gordonia sp. MP11Mi TaxID=3022769 RepID=A0AA97CV02_9ACTN
MQYTDKVPADLRAAYDAAPGPSGTDVQLWASRAHDDKYPRDPERPTAGVYPDAACAALDTDDYVQGEHLRRMEHALNTITKGDAR